jgi:hypothetical protein
MNVYANVKWVFEIWHMSIWNIVVGFDECLCKCYMSNWNIAVGFDNCLRECYMSVCLKW